MNKRQAERRLRDLGFQIAWDVTGRTPRGDRWEGTIDPVGRYSIAGDCCGLVVIAGNAPEWYAAAVADAEDNAPGLVPCDDAECDYHADEEVDRCP